MAIRQNPTNPCVIESSVNGVDWCPFIDLSKCQNFGTQPGEGSPQPAPGGGTQQYCFKLSAAGRKLLPVTVSDGDTITLDNANGAGHDGSGVDGSGLWRLPNGDQFFGGIDVGFPRTVETDPMPAVNHMKIIAGAGSTPDWFELTTGSPVTISGGLTQAQIWIQVNDSNLLDNEGDYDVCVTVSNSHVVALSSTNGNTVPPFVNIGESITVDSVVQSNGVFCENRIGLAFAPGVKIVIDGQTGYTPFNDGTEYTGAGCGAGGGVASSSNRWNYTPSGGPAVTHNYPAGSGGPIEINAEFGGFITALYGTSSTPWSLTFHITDNQ